MIDTLEFNIFVGHLLHFFHISQHSVFSFIFIFIFITLSIQFRGSKLYLLEVGTHSYVLCLFDRVNTGSGPRKKV